MSSIVRCSNAEMSTLVVTLTTFACVVSTFRNDRLIEQLPFLAIGGTAVTMATAAIAFKFFKAIDSQKDSPALAYLKSPYFTATLASLIVENKNLLSFELVREVGLVVLGLHICKEAASIVSPFLIGSQLEPLASEEVIEEYTPPTTSIDYQKAFNMKGLSGPWKVQIGNDYVLSDEEVDIALKDQWQKVRIASNAYMDLGKKPFYNTFILKAAPQKAKINDNVCWDSLWLDSCSFKSRSIEVCGLKAGICESIGSFREDMEDRTLVAEIEVSGIKLPVFGVFDGHGRSDEAARYVETHLPTKLKEKFEFFLERSESTDLTDTVIYNALKSSLITLNTEYKGNGGTTVNVVIAHNKHLYTANIGDSRSITINEKTGSVQVLSEDAKPNDPRHKQIIEALGGSVKEVNGTWRASSGHAMGSAFVNPRAKKAMNPTVDITKNPMTPGSLVIIASDGVWDTVTPFQLGKALGNRHFSFRTSEQAIAEDAVYSSLTNHSTDNLSTVVIRIPLIKGSGWFG